MSSLGVGFVRSEKEAAGAPGRTELPLPSDHTLRGPKYQAALTYQYV